MNLPQTLCAILKESKEELTVAKITSEMKDRFLKGGIGIDAIPPALQKDFQKAKDSGQQSLSKDSYNSLRRCIYIALNNNAKSGKIRRIEQAESGEGYLKYRFAEEKESNKISPAEEEKITNKLSAREKELYPLLRQYLLFRHGIGSRRIEESKSRSHNEKGRNHWRYPDIVGIEDISSNWDKSLEKFVKRDLNLQIKFWSFEVKVVLERVSLRKDFFQAVANSSWANFGYLVAETIDGVEDELSMLSNHHGIGVILLDNKSENPEDSRSHIKYPAREKPTIDWAMANKLAEESNDFGKCMERIQAFYYGDNSNRQFMKKEWDEFWGIETLDGDIESSDDN